MPVILGPDGPSLGGFVCPAIVARADLWKLGQLRPGDRIRFHCISCGDAVARREVQDESIGALEAPHAPSIGVGDAAPCMSSVLYQAGEGNDALCVRQSGE